MKQLKPMVTGKARAELVDKARTKRNRTAVARKGKEAARRVVEGGSPPADGLTGAVQDIAQSAVTTVEGLVKTVSGKIHEIVGEHLSDSPRAPGNAHLPSP